MKNNYGKSSGRFLLKLAVMVLITAVAVCMMPGAGLFTGQSAAYAADNELQGVVAASDLTLMADYTLAGDTVIKVDASKIIGALHIGSYELSIEASEEAPDEILSIYGGIDGYKGKVNLNGGFLDLDLTNESSGLRYPAAINLTMGTFSINGGGLFINYTSNDPTALSASAINVAAFSMTDGSATITCTTGAGIATGISARSFDMSGGSLGVDAKATAAGMTAIGISPGGSGSDAPFKMSGGSLRAEGTAPEYGYGIYWSADSTQSVFVISGGTVQAKGSRNGILNWAETFISGGAQVTAQSTYGGAITVDGALIQISDTGTKVTATSQESRAIIVYNDRINDNDDVSDNDSRNFLYCSDSLSIVIPEGGKIKAPVPGQATVVDASDNPAKNVVITGQAVPSVIAITYDASKVFPTTRLTGKDVSLHLLKNVTSNPGSVNAHDGWYVYAADPDKSKLDLSTSSWTCLAVKNGDSYQTLENSDELLNTEDEYYLRFNIENDDGYGFDMNTTYTATVNGQPAEYVTQPGYDDGDLLVYKRVYLDESSDVIWSLAVTPEESSIVPDGFRQFSVTAVAATTDDVTWSVTGNDSVGTYITSAGRLHAGSGEHTGHDLTVRATSTVDATVYDEVSVAVVDEVPYIESVTLTCEKTEICRGTSAKVIAEVVGTDIKDLNWQLIGSDGSSYFNGENNYYRYLHVGLEEQSEFITVKASSVADPSKYGEITFRITDKSVIYGPIDITYDESAVKLTESKTGAQVTEVFIAAITSPKGTGLAVADAPGGWYVYVDSNYTGLVKKSGSGFDKLLDSSEYLSPDEEYYLWFNVEDCDDTHYFNNSEMDLSDLGITVNGKKLNGDIVQAGWGSPLEVYYRVYLEGQEPEPVDPLERIAGPNRFDTSIEAANKLKAQLDLDKFPAVVIASGMDFPDALAGAYLGIAKDAPVLLTHTSVASKIAEYVKNNMEEDGTVYILGGTGAVPEVMETELEALGITNIDRLAGANRFETNILILQRAGVSGKDLLICAANGYADSLSASAVGQPILLVGNSLTDAQKEYLESIQSDISGKCYAIGGTGVVSDDVFDQVKAYAAGESKRVAGANRFATSVAVAEEFCPSTIDTVVLAYAMNYPDGLAGGPVAHAFHAPLLLVNDSNYTLAKDYVAHTYATKVKVMGGTSLIADATALAIVE